MTKKPPQSSILSQLNPVQTLISSFCKIYRMSRKSLSICAFQYAGSGEVPYKTLQVSYVTSNTRPLGSLSTLSLKVSTEFGQQLLLCLLINSNQIHTYTTTETGMFYYYNFCATFSVVHSTNTRCSIPIRKGEVCYRRCLPFKINLTKYINSQ